ncbi:unnamed protein product [Caenorhabditis auriculariae]|uniref:Uncharacterized protein n=1 Tax=Caenorhabditis auriculariae TaxID=2777116 RepID=A0A8S1HT01_9PELO|nr:unnamed protein product [Caenorhabditis auriculariae]
MERVGNYYYVKDGHVVTAIFMAFPHSERLRAGRLEHPHNPVAICLPAYEVRAVLNAAIRKVCSTPLPPITSPTYAPMMLMAIKIIFSLKIFEQNEARRIQEQELEG